MIMADLSWGHINIFREDTRGLCFSWYTRGFCSQGMQRTIKSNSQKLLIIRGNYILSRNHIHFKELMSSF